MIAQNQNNQNIAAPIESFDGTQAQEEIRKRKSRRSKYDVSHLYEEGAMGFQSGFVPDAVKDAISGLTADPSLDLKCMKSRTVFTDEQMLILETAYQRADHAEPDKRNMVAQLCGLDEERVRIWYQNRRAKEKRQQEDDLAFLAKKMAERDMHKNPSFITIEQRLNAIFGSKQDKRELQKLQQQEQQQLEQLQEQQQQQQQQQQPYVDNYLQSVLKINPPPHFNSTAKPAERKRRAPVKSTVNVKKSRVRRTKEQIEADNKNILLNLNKRAPKKNSEIALIKSIMRGEDAHTSNNDNTASTPHTAVNKYPNTFSVGNEEGQKQKEFSQNFMMDNILKDNHNVKNEPMYPRTGFPSMPTNQQPMFNNYGWGNMQTPFPGYKQNMTPMEMRNMLAFQQNMINQYQRMLMGGHGYPWQATNPFAGETGATTLNPFVQMSNNPFNNPYHYQLPSSHTSMENNPNSFISSNPETFWEPKQEEPLLDTIPSYTTELSMPENRPYINTMDQNIRHQMSEMINNYSNNQMENMEDTNYSYSSSSGIAGNATQDEELDQEALDYYSNQLASAHEALNGLDENLQAEMMEDSNAGSFTSSVANEWDKTIKEFQEQLRKDRLEDLPPSPTNGVHENSSGNVEKPLENIGIQSSESGKSILPSSDMDDTEDYNNANEVTNTQEQEVTNPDTEREEAEKMTQDCSDASNDVSICTNSKGSEEENETASH